MSERIANILRKISLFGMSIFFVGIGIIESTINENVIALLYFGTVFVFIALLRILDLEERVKKLEVLKK